MERQNIADQREKQKLTPLHIPDTYSQEGASEIATAIREYWLDRGYRGIRVWIAPIKERKNMFQARSNIGPDGRPPRHRS